MAIVNFSILIRHYSEAENIVVFRKLCVDLYKWFVTPKEQRIQGLIRDVVKNIEVIILEL